jgi:hypothetical protein
MNVHPLRSGAGIVLGNNPLDSTSRCRRYRAAANGVVLHPLSLTELRVLRGRHGARRRDAGDVMGGGIASAALRSGGGFESVKGL